MWHNWVQRASEAKAAGAKPTTDLEKNIQAQRARSDQENMLLPISRKRAFQESMAALEECEEADGDSALPPSSKKQLQKTVKEDKIEKKRRLKERATAFNERFVDQGDRLINVVEVMSSKIGPLAGSAASATDSENTKRLAILEAKVSKVKEVGEAMAEQIDDSAVKLDQIFQILQEMRSKA